MVNIETGVDRLVGLIKEKHKISVVEAAKILSVSKTLIQEWASFLEEEKIIDIDYMLTNTFLIEKKVTEEDFNNKKIEFKNLKEMFARKVDTFLQSIEKDTEGVDRLKKQFEKIKKELSVEVLNVKEELKELEAYESLKQDIDKQIIDQQAGYKKKIEEAHQKISQEEKKYDEIIKAIDLEKQSLTDETKEVNSLEVQEEKLLGKVEDINKLVSEIDKEIHSENKKIDGTKLRIKELDSYASQILEEVKHKKNIFKPLLSEGSKQEKKIQELQDNLLKKVMDKKKIISDAADEGEKVLSSFNKFFNNKKDLDDLFNKIEGDKANLKQELNNLLKKAKALEVVSGSEDIKKHIDSLKSSMKQVDVKKNLFQEEINRLKSLIQFK